MEPYHCNAFELIVLSIIVWLQGGILCLMSRSEESKVWKVVWKGLSAFCWIVAIFYVIMAHIRGWTTCGI